MKFPLMAISGLALALAGCGGPGGGGRPPAPAPTPAPPTAGAVVFLEQFDGSALDRKRWNVIGPDFWVNNEQQAYIDSPDTIFQRDGVLVLKPVWRPGADPHPTRKADIVSGRIDSSRKFDFQHGRAEARIRMTHATGFWPAFWLLGYGGWPASGEIDIMEYIGEPDWVSSALHGPGYSGEKALVGRYTFPAGQVPGGWHVYGVDWSKDAITFTVDGNRFKTFTRAEVEASGAWKFDNAKFVILNAAVGGGYPAGVNKVTSPYYGLPQATVDRIKKGEVEFEVDWVRVTKLR